MKQIFLVTSTYKATSEALALALPDHKEWVGKLYDQGTFIVSGRLAPFTGGFMMAVGVSRETLETILATDPFRLGGLLDHTILELAPTRWVPEFASLIGEPQ